MITEHQIAQVINAVIEREGGYVNNVHDRGGATNFGITQATADDFAIGDVRNLTAQRAFGVYRRMFADWGIDQMPEFHTFALVADSCVNHGSWRGIKWMQQGLGIVDDGVIGPQTLQALEAIDKVPRGNQGLYASILALRTQFYGAILANDHSQVTFAHGWLNRIAGLMRPWPY